jgi:hypothetical protein
MTPPNRRNGGKRRCCASHEGCKARSHTYLAARAFQCEFPRSTNAQTHDRDDIRICNESVLCMRDIALQDPVCSKCVAPPSKHAARRSGSGETKRQKWRRGASLDGRPHLAHALIAKRSLLIPFPAHHNSRPHLLASGIYKQSDALYRRGYTHTHTAPVGYRHTFLSTRDTGILGGHTASASCNCSPDTYLPCRTPVSTHHLAYTHLRRRMSDSPP